MSVPSLMRPPAERAREGAQDARRQFAARRDKRVIPFLWGNLRTADLRAGLQCTLGPTEAGVDTPGGTGTVVQTLASGFAEGPETVVISADMAHPVNGVPWAAIVAVADQSAQAVLPLVPWAHGNATPLNNAGAPERTPPACQSGSAAGLPPWDCCCSRSNCSPCWSGLTQHARRHRLCRTLPT